MRRLQAQTAASIAPLLQMLSPLAPLQAVQPLLQFPMFFTEAHRRRTWTLL
jgi:hypothetical protein